MSQISVLLHNVPDTPSGKQFFFSFWLREHINMPSEMDGWSLSCFIFSFVPSLCRVQRSSAPSSLTLPASTHIVGRKKN